MLKEIQDEVYLTQEMNFKAESNAITISFYREGLATTTRYFVLTNDDQKTLRVQENHQRM